MTQSSSISAHKGRREEYAIKEEEEWTWRRKKENESDFSPSLSLTMVRGYLISILMLGNDIIN